MSRWDECREHFRRFKMDAARWIEPMAVRDVAELTPPKIAKLTWLYPGLRVMLWFRVASAARTLGLRGVPTILQHRLLTRFGVELIPGDEIGGGLYIAHPVGCTLVAYRIGTNVTIISGVTFGYQKGRGWPSIGDRSYFGAGCRVLGAISIGADAVVGANAVVLDDVPEGTTVVGVPARPIRSRTADDAADSAEEALSTAAS